MSGHKRVSDVATQIQRFEGSSVKVRQLVGKDFVITRIVELTDKDGPYLGVQVEGDGKPFFFFTRHVVVERKLRECIGAEPLLATIKKVEGDENGYSYFDIE